MKVTTDGFQFFVQKPLITRLWDPDMPLDKDCIQKVPIWIKLPRLALKYWGEKSLYKIAGLVGHAVQMDKATKMKDRLQYARVMVEIQLQQDLNSLMLSFFVMSIEMWWNSRWSMSGDLLSAKKCGRIGHSEQDCRKGEPVKKWVPKKQVRVDKEGFQMVGGGAVIVEKIPEVPVHNSFNALLDDAKVSKEDEVKEQTSADDNNRVIVHPVEEIRDKGQGLKAPMPNG